MAIAPNFNAKVYPGGGTISGAGARVETVFDHQRQMHVSIVHADNGFVLIMRNDYGMQGRILIANSVQELNDLITSELVAQKLEK